MLDVNGIVSYKLAYFISNYWAQQFGNLLVGLTCRYARWNINDMRSKTVYSARHAYNYDSV